MENEKHDFLEEDVISMGAYAFLSEIPDEDIKLYWPCLAERGLTGVLITKIIEKRTQVNKTSRYIFWGLDHAEYELEHEMMKDRNGNPVKDPINFVFNVLVKKGYYERPKTYISPEEQAECDATTEIEKLEVALQSRIWSDYKLLKFLRSRELILEYVTLRDYWEKNVKNK